LEEYRASDVIECERLRERLYSMFDEWEGLVERQRELERQFVDNDLYVASGLRKGQPLTANGRQRRLIELLDVSERARDLQKSITWVERRRVRLLNKLYDPA
jgi:hypothetical protein